MNLLTALKHDFSVYVTKNYESSDKQMSLISLMAFYPAFIPTHALFEEKLENKNFSKASRWEIAKTSILPTTCFKQFLCSSLLASTFGKSLSAVFVASLNSAWRHVESVITAISHFSLWSKTLHCWQKLSKSTNQRVYQDLVYRNALLLKILTSVPAPLSPVRLYFSSFSLLRTALHYLNAWNRLLKTRKKSRFLCLRHP